MKQTVASIFKLKEYWNTNKDKTLEQWKAEVKLVIKHDKQPFLVMPLHEALEVLKLPEDSWSDVSFCLCFHHLLLLVS